MEHETAEETHRFIEGGGEMGKLTRSFDWSSSSIGAPDQWPQSLRTTLGIILHSAFPMFLFWGKDLICFYNDAFLPSLGIDGKHPALGKKGIEVWPEIWSFIGPLIEQVMTSGEPVWFEDQLVPFYRNGRMEDIYWTFSYSPAYGDDGDINGVFVTCTETTGKVITNKKLKKNEQNLRNTITQAPIAMCILTGPDHVVEIANDRMLELWGKKVSDVVNKPIFEGLPEAKGQGFEELLDGVFTSGRTFSAQAAPVMLPRGDQIETVYVNFVYEAYRESSGEISGVIVVALDVSDQVIAHRKLEESEQHVRSIVESAPFPIGVYKGREMRITMVNQAIKDVWGKGNDIVGKLYADVLPELENQKIYPQLDEVYITGIPFHARNQRVDLQVEGRLQSYYFNYSFTPLFDADGNVYGVVNTAADITDLNIAKQKVEQSERNFRNMVLQAPVAMCILLGPDHVVEIVNEHMLEIWGKHLGDVLNKPIFEGLSEARQQGLEQLLGQVYATGETFKANERPVDLLRNGRLETVYLNFVYEPYRDAGNVILGILAISIDVTEQVLARRKIEEVVADRTRELAAANSNLQRSNAELAQFAYIASHDLQEPARKVSIFTQMLENNLHTSDERAKNYFVKIKNAASRMLVLIRDVLTYSELSRVNHGYTKVDLQQVIEDIKVDFELLVEQKEAIIQTGKLPVIDAIPLHMSQLFGNILSNALKYGRPGIKPIIAIEGGILSKDEIKARVILNEDIEYCKISITDNGIGFNQEYARQIFNIFQRLHGKKDFEGTGIGLALCQKIVQNHHGDIYALSTPDKGSTFVVILPVKQVPITQFKDPFV
jgi:PAS domain S-box-containing protein